LTRPEIRAAGGVLWRRANHGSVSEGLEVALVHRPRYDDWSLPKGKLVPGETDLEAALREVREETGQQPRPGRSLGTVRYLKTSSDGMIRPKIVSYWAMEANGGVFTPDREVDGIRWVTTDEARELLTYPTDREVLGRFESQPLTTGLVLLVRHASAGRRSKWRGDDRGRPLDAKGVEQARAVTRLLGRFGVTGILSAEHVRCVQTVEPLSRLIGVRVREAPLISELGYPGHEREAVEQLREEADGDCRVVACSQGDVIPDLLHRLAAQDRVALSGELEAAKGSVWVLGFAHGKLCSLEYFPPPAFGG
jgi:8-oxo-dGTP pyrophosphatase MutT (NUDIX family)/broad specificity phosphatase PhoE